MQNHKVSPSLGEQCQCFLKKLMWLPLNICRRFVGGGSLKFDLSSTEKGASGKVASKRTSHWWRGEGKMVVGMEKEALNSKDSILY